MSDLQRFLDVESVKIDYKCTDGFKFEVTLNRTQILEDHDDFQERFFPWQIAFPP